MQTGLDNADTIEAAICHIIADTIEAIVCFNYGDKDSYFANAKRPP